MLPSVGGRDRRVVKMFMVDVPRGRAAALVEVFRNPRDAERALAARPVLVPETYRVANVVVEIDLGFANERQLGRLRAAVRALGSAVRIA